MLKQKIYDFILHERFYIGVNNFDKLVNYLIYYIIFLISVLVVFMALGLKSIITPLVILGLMLLYPAIIIWQEAIFAKWCLEYKYE